MPREILTRGGREFFFRDYSLPDPAPREVRVRVTFAAPKHGTERHTITGSAFEHRRWDPELRLFLPQEHPPAAAADREMGNIVAGVVTATGVEVERFRIGDRVFGYGRIREEHQTAEDRLYPMENLTAEDAVCTDPAHVAFVAIRDGNIRVGDRVAVFGLGAIGLMAVQIARVGGARKVFAVDPLAIRRAAAARLGAIPLDPSSVDAAFEIKQGTDRKGADVAVETSGSSAALHAAIRCIQQCGTVVHVPWGPADCSQLHLDQEWHLNRPTLVGSQAWSGWGNPDRDHPLWTHERAFQATVELFTAGLITGRGVVEPIVLFDEAPAALSRIFSAPETTIKVGLVFPDGEHRV